MSSSSDAITERIAKLQLTDTLSKLSPRETISPKSLVDAGASQAAPVRTLIATSTSNLPRISIDMRQVDLEESSTIPDMADLRVVKLLGEGGMGRVLLAEQRSLGREVAIKTLKDGENSLQTIGGLLREARLSGALEHPGIVPVHALGLTDSQIPVLVMKRIEGVSLRALLDDAEHVAWQTQSSGATDRLEASLRILMRVCEAVAFAHNRGILHCDIKPDNIMVGAYGEVYLCDWGVAVRLDERHQLENAFAGTPAYMAPEMLWGDRIDVYTDVYLLGGTLHHVLTGRERHEGQKMPQILNSVALSEAFPYDSHVPVELADLCNRATSRDPDLRPVSAEAFKNEMAEYLRKRSATVLSHAAQERLAVLETALSAEKLEDLALLYRHANEARFGFDHALRIESTLAKAQQGLQHTLEAMFDLELRQGHIESAAALLQEMKEVPKQLEARLEEARQNAERQRTEAEKFRAMARELDPRIEASLRTWGTILAVSVTLAVIGIATRGKGVNNATAADLVWFAIAMSVCCGIVFGAYRRRIFKTLFNRRIVGYIGLFCVFLVFNRTIGWYLNHSPETIIGTDTLLIASMTALFALFADLRMAIVALWLACIRILMILYPQASASLFTLAGIGTSVIFILIWKPSKNIEEKPSAP